MPTTLSRRRRVLIGLGVVLFLWAWLPLLSDGSFGVGVVLPALSAALWLVVALYAPPYRKAKGWIKAMWIACVVVCSVLAAVAGAVAALNAVSAVTTPREGATVIVLGAKIYGDQPSRMMRQRLDVAADRLEADATAHCVVSGGLGPGETYTEAYVMKKYLVEQRGIHPDRVACEETSTNTHENLHFSLNVIREKGWSTDVAVATQAFHQYRSRQLAYRAGARSVGGAACLSPAHLMLYYWMRECAAVCRLWLMGY